MPSTRNRVKLGAGRDGGEEIIYFRGNAVEIVYRDHDGNQVILRRSLGGNQNGLGTTRLIIKGNG